MTDCIFCKIVNGDLPAERIYENERLLVFKDRSPKAKIHLLVIPKQHIPSLAEATPEEAPLLAEMLLVLNKVALSQGLQRGFKTQIHTGVEGGQEVGHLHFHLLGGGQP